MLCRPTKPQQQQAKDGVCDDGRFLHNMTRGLPSTVLCDLGTDCSDCGPWKGAQHSSAWCAGNIWAEHPTEQRTTAAAS